GLRSSVFGLALRPHVRRELGLEAFRLGLVLAQGGFEALNGVGSGVLPALVRVMDGVAERLGGFVGELANSKELEPDLSLVDCSARGLACAAEFGGQLIPKCHATLPRWLHYRTYAAEVSCVG